MRQIAQSPSSLDLDEHLTKVKEKEVLKKEKRTMRWSCTRQECEVYETVGGTTFKRCAKCRRPYCSKECQKQDWPEHKQECESTTLESPSQEKALQYLISNRKLLPYFELLVVLYFNMHLLGPEELSRCVKERFELDVCLQIEPADYENFFRIYKQTGVDDSTSMQGMLQIVCVKAPDESRLNTKVRRGWESRITQPLEGSQSLLQNEGGAPIQEVDSLSVFINFRLGVGNGELLVSLTPTLCLEIEPRIIQLAREANPITLPFDHKMPLTLDSSIIQINMFIRYDSDNEWSLRASMSKRNKMIYAIASTTLSDPSRLDYFTDPIREKVKREKVFYAVAALQYGFTRNSLGGMPPPGVWVKNVREKRPIVGIQFTKAKYNGARASFGKDHRRL